MKDAAFPWLLAALGLALVGLSFGGLAGFAEDVDHCELLFCDFERHYLATAQALRLGGELPSGFLYPPAFAVLLLPLSALDRSAANLLWAVVQLASTALLFALPTRAARAAGRGAAGFYAVAFALSFPLVHNLAWGQISVLVAALVLAGFRALASRRARGGGALLAVAAAMKVFPLGFAVLVGMQRRWRALRAWLATLALCALAPIAVLGWERHAELCRHVLGDLRRAREWVPGDPNSQFAAHVVGRWLPHAPAWLPGAVTLAGALGVAGLAWVRLREVRTRGDADASWLVAPALGFTLLPFVLATSWPHYFVFLPSVLVTALLSLPPGGASGAPTRAAVWLLAITSAALASTPVWWLFPDHRAYAASGLLFVAHLAATAALHVSLRAAARAGVSSGHVEPSPRAD